MTTKRRVTGYRCPFCRADKNPFDTMHALSEHITQYHGKSFNIKKTNVSCQLPQIMIEMIDSIVESFYMSRSHFIRTAIENQLMRDRNLIGGLLGIDHEFEDWSNLDAKLLGIEVIYDDSGVN